MKRILLPLGLVIFSSCWAVMVDVGAVTEELVEVADALYYKIDLQKHSEGAGIMSSEYIKMSMDIIKPFEFQMQQLNVAAASGKRWGRLHHRVSLNTESKSKLSATNKYTYEILRIMHEETKDYYCFEQGYTMPITFSKRDIESHVRKLSYVIRIFESKEAFLQDYNDSSGE